MHCGIAIWSDWCRFALPPPIVDVFGASTSTSGIDAWADVPPVAASRSSFSSMFSTRWEPHLEPQSAGLGTRRRRRRPARQDLYRGPGPANCGDLRKTPDPNQVVDSRASPLSRDGSARHIQMAALSRPADFSAVLPIGVR